MSLGVSGTRELLGRAPRYLLQALVFVLAFLAQTQPVQAGARDNKEKAAKKACISGDYAKGVALLSNLYVDTDDITYVFNQGRCFEQNGRYEDAILRFREYSRKVKDAGLPPDAEVERHIADCQALLGKAPEQTGSTRIPAPGLASPPPPPTPPVAALTRSAPEASAPTVAQPDVVKTAPPDTMAGAGWRVAGLTTFAVGFAGVATGVVLNLKANDLADELEASTASYRRGKENTRATYETLGWGAYSAGLACMAGGAILYYLGYRKGRSSQVTFLPAAGPRVAGAAVRGAF